MVLLAGGCRLDAFGVGSGGGTEDGGSETTGGGVTSLDPSADGTTIVVTGNAAETTGDGTTTQSSGLPTAGSTTDATADSDASGSTGGEGEPLCVPQAGLEACYDFLGVGGGTLLDLSGNGNDAPAVGIGVVPGPFGDAATFGADAQIAVADSPSLDVDTVITTEAWILLDSLPSGTRMGVIDNDGQYAMTIQATDQYRCSGAGMSLLHGPVALGRWTHMACVYDGAAMRLFLDGTEAATLPNTGPLNTGNTEPMSVGDTSPAFSQPLEGALGGLRIWSVVRTPEQLCEAAGESCAG